MHRFYLPDFQKPTLSAAEAQRAFNLIKAGDTVNVFDGRGHEAQCAVRETSADSVHLSVLQQAATPPLRCHITLAQAGPKKNLDLIIQKPTELGVSSIVPLVSDRVGGVIDPGAEAHWLETCIEACRQSGNNRIPELRPPQKAADFINGIDSRAYSLKLIASLQPDSRPLKKILPDVVSPVASVLVMIGPDGDFTPAEINLAKNAGCLPLSLGPLVLRAETAAIYALSILHHELQIP